MDIHEKIIGKKVIDMAYYDGLTRLHSRQYFIDLLSKRIEAYHNEGMPFSLALIDMDDFKRINDSFGHRCGDIVLMKVAEVIGGTVRAGDIGARYGGDEFIVLFDGVDEASAMTIVHRIEEEIASLEFDFDSQLARVSCSIGMVQFNSEFTMESFIASADQRMYQDKNRKKAQL